MPPEETSGDPSDPESPAGSGGQDSQQDGSPPGPSPGAAAGTAAGAAAAAGDPAGSPAAAAGASRKYPPPATHEAFWPAQLTILVAIGMQVSLPQRLTVGPSWLIPSLEALLLLGMFLATPRQLEREHAGRRRVALSLTALVSGANIYSLAELGHFLLRHSSPNPKQLILSGVVIWLTNVLIFALWYWEIDRGGAGKRAAGNDLPPDFLFPQMSDDTIEPRGWRPKFIDYLYTSLTNATAFSPTDTMPLTPIAKSVMGIQSLVSLVTLGLVISRAVNIL